MEQTMKTARSLLINIACAIALALPSVLALGAVQDCLDPATFGAAGNGTTDDTAALQKAINALSASSVQTLCAKGKTYGISTALAVPAGSEFRFTGGAGFKALAGFSTILVGGINNGVMLHITGANVTLDGVVLDANNITTVPMVGAWADTAANYTNIRNCTFKNIYYYGGGLISSGVIYRANTYSTVRHSLFLHVAAGATTQGGNGVIFDDNDYISNTTGTRDTAFGLDGGQGVQVTNNRIHYENGTGTVTSIIGVTSGATDFTVSGNKIFGQNSGKGINVDPLGGGSVDYGLIANNLIDGKSVAGTATWIAIYMGPTVSNVTIQGNTLTSGATGYSSSYAINLGTGANIVRGNTLTMSGVQAAIGIGPGGGTTGRSEISNNYCSTNSACVQVGGDNSGKVLWIKNNEFHTASVGVQGQTLTESQFPVYMQDNHFNDITGTPITGFRWDNAFASALSGNAGDFPHYLGKHTVLQTYAMPDDGTHPFTTGADAGFQVGDQFWFNTPVAGGSMGKICITAGVVGAGAAFKAMPTLAP